jgi:hypothetical protein
VLGQGGLGDPDAAAAATCGGEQVAGAGAGANAVLLAAPKDQRGGEFFELVGVGVGGVLGDGGGGPADRLDAGHLQAELVGEGGVAAVVVATLAAGVLDVSGLGEAVGGLVQQGAEHIDRAALEAFAADQDLVAVGAVDLPAVGGEVAQIQTLALGAGGDDQHRLGHLRVAATDALPGVLQGRDQQAGRPVRRGGVGG